MRDTELQQQALRQTRLLLAQAAEHYGISSPVVEIRFDLRGKSAGMASHGAAEGMRIRYNRVLLEENGEDFLRRTVPHEVAHLITRLVFGPRCRPHGEEWRRVMRFFGADTSRCHGYDTSRARARTLREYPYVCGCRDHSLTSIRHNRARRGQRYLCRACGGALKPKA
jgi:SprT protein